MVSRNLSRQRWPRISGSISVRTIAILVTGLSGLSFVTVEHLRSPNSTPVMRGMTIADRLGCFGCHGPGGTGGHRNPGSVEGEVPPLEAGGAFLFFAHDEQEIREWILDGSPQRLQEDPRPAGIIEMPAYRGYLSAGQVDDLVAYIRCVALARAPEEPLARAGFDIASERGCFACHGPHGRGGLRNPGSFKGVIPPWDSADFPHLVKDEDELREWILDGEIQRFESNPLARFFTHRQVIQMPAYRDVLAEEEVDALVSYVHWTRENFECAETARNLVPSPAEPTSVVQRGEFLYRTAGCATCHGASGRGGVPNPNAPGEFVPALNLTAVRMQLFEPEEVSAIVAEFDRGVDMRELLDDPPIEYFEDFLEAYEQTLHVILEGDLPGKRNRAGPAPPMRMPAWTERMHADGGPLSRADIDAVVAYLLTLQEFE